MEISIWLGIALSSRLSIIADNSSDLIEIIKSFRGHVKAVYSLDAFYGDETLEGLLEHARALNLLLEEQYGDIAALSEDIEYENQEIDQDAEEEEEKEQHVLYAGSRRRDS